LSGRTDVTITFEDLALHDELILAEPVGPYSNLVFNENAEADGSQLRIRETPVVPGRTRLSLSGTRLTHKRLTWRCILSNILTRARAVLQMKRWPPLGERLRLNADWRERDWVAHVVTMHCKELIIEIRLCQGAAPGPLFTGQVSMRVFDRKHDAEDKEDTSEADRCEITPSTDGRSVVARVERPVLGYRYVLGYRPALAGVAYERDATLMWIRNVADVARRSAPGPRCARL
jgi:hypothetical protein